MLEYVAVLNAFEVFSTRNVNKTITTTSTTRFISSDPWPGITRTVLEETAAETGIQIGTIMQSPWKDFIHVSFKKKLSGQQMAL